MSIHTEEKDASKEAYILRAGAFEQEGSSVDEYAVLIEGLRANFDNYELYFMLGLYYRYRNADQAFLCFENALCYCDEPEDEPVIKAAMDDISDRARVRGTSIVIASYNDLELVKECIYAIRRYSLKGSYEIVVVDNASTDEDVIRFLREQAEKSKDFVLVENKKNEGFPKGCNIGLRAANPENDVFFLNNDAILMPNSLFWLRMGLYSDKRNGAAGAVTNSAPSQEVAEAAFTPYLEKVPMTGARPMVNLQGKPMQSTEQVEGEHRWWRTISLDSALEASKNYAKDHNVPMWNPIEVRFRLTGFACLIKQEMIERVLICKDTGNELFDERFSPGYFEDDDLGIRTCLAGYRQVLCHNAFIYHHGGSGFADKSEAMEESRKKFSEKWGFDVWGYMLPDEDKITALFTAENEKSGDDSLKGADYLGAKLYNRSFRLLDIEAGMGSTLSAIKYLIPGCYGVGITNADVFAGLSTFMADDMVSGNPELVTFPWPEHSFDYILAGDVVANAEDPEALLKKLGRYLSANGRII